MNGVPFAFWKPASSPPPPSLSVSLSKDGPDPIEPGTSLGVTAIVTGGTAAATFSIESGPGSLSAVTGTTATFDADAITEGATVIRATHDDDGLVYDEVTITTETFPAVSLSKDGPDPIALGDSLGVTAIVAGGTAAATFTIESGPGSLSAVTGTTATFDADAVVDGTTVIRATHDDDPLVFDEVSIITDPAPPPPTPTPFDVATSDALGTNLNQLYYSNSSGEWKEAVGAAVIETGKVCITVVTEDAYYTGPITVAPTAGGTPHLSFGAWTIATQYTSLGLYYTTYESTVTPINGSMGAPGFEGWTAWYPDTAPIGTVPSTQECTFRVYNTFP
jgi:hypothetical protein